MSDERLRWGERHWRKSGSPEDEVRHLRARLRAGRVDLVRLALAAECGHPAARAALGDRPLDTAPPSLRELTARVERAGDDEARVRAAAALAHALFGHEAQEEPVRRGAERALDATEEWLRCRCPGHLGNALRAWGDVAPEPVPAWLPPAAATSAASADAATLLRLAVGAVERAGVTARGLAHLRVSWLPWLVG
jgi:hypothetical protein